MILCELILPSAAACARRRVAGARGGQAWWSRPAPRHTPRRTAGWENKKSLVFVYEFNRISK